MSQSFKLLSREEFKDKVFARDDYKCLVCGEPAADAHHILERDLFDDDGFYLENGASVCNACHIKAEMTLITVEELRALAGIKVPVLPAGIYESDVVDKWGNYILPNGTRMRGPLFYDDGCQKILGKAGLLDSFSERVKYPQTKHLPISPGRSKDDGIITDLTQLVGHECVATEKGDGENWTMYRGHGNCHARSLDGRDHWTRSSAKQFHAAVEGDIPEGWRVSTENMFAMHSIYYPATPLLWGLSIWNERNVSLPYDETLEYFSLLNITPAPLLWRGVFTMKIAEELAASLDVEKQEGFVVRRVDEIPYSMFGKRLAKWVRKGHVQTDDHWMHGDVKKNGIIYP